MSDLIISSNLFFPFPKSLITEGTWAQLNLPEQVVFLSLASFADENGQAHPGRKALLERSNFSKYDEKRVTNATKGLERKVRGFKVIRMRVGRCRTFNEYKLPLPPREGGRYKRGKYAPLFHDVVKHRVFTGMSSAAKALYVVLRSMAIPPDSYEDPYAWADVSKEMDAFVESCGVALCDGLQPIYSKRPFELFHEGPLHGRGGLVGILSSLSGHTRNTVKKALEEMKAVGLCLSGQGWSGEELHLVRVRAPLPPYDEEWKNQGNDNDDEMLQANCQKHTFCIDQKHTL